MLEQIRRSVHDGFYSMPRGGLEVGGVLFGTRDGSTVRIEAFRTTPCQHAFGPSFTLSESDRRELAVVLERARADALLAGFESLGWYHSHTRSDIHLSPQDVEIYNRFFPSPWQIALVLRPEHSGATRLGFFFREADGNLRTVASYREYQLEPAFRVSEQTPVSPPAEPNRSAAAAFEIAASTAWPEPEKAIVPIAPQPPPIFNGGGAEPPRVIVKPPIPPPPPRRWPPEEPPEPRFLHPPEFSPVSRRPIVLLLITASLMVGLYATRDQWLQVLYPVNLRLMETDGELIVRWNADSSQLMSADRATLEIQDGGEKLVKELDPDVRSWGAYSYRRKTEEVQARLVLRQPQGELHSERAVFKGPVPPPSKEVEAVRKALQEENQRLRDQLKAEQERAVRLERRIRDLL
ncbi:MAG: hypothetical protein WD696_12540 [Bryobacteraceae bacterium]